MIGFCEGVAMHSALSLRIRNCYTRALIALILFAGILHCRAEAADDDLRYLQPEDAPAFSQPQFITLPPPRAFPGALYETRAAVTGGTWPYCFELRTAPAGMQLDPASGAIAWQAPGQPEVAQVTLLVRDQTGRQAEQSFQIEVTAKGFYFVSPTGDDANPGTFDQPWETLMRAVEDIPEADISTLYLRGGDYAVVVPPKDSSKRANTLVISSQSPRRWVAWPGEKPVIDLGWSEAQWTAALEFERGLHGDKGTTKNYGYRIEIGRGIDDLLFDGLEVKNAAYFMFIMYDGNRSRLTWRRCKLHHLYGDYFENPSFIFGYAPDRQYEKLQPGETGRFPFGKRPIAKPYRNIVIQECSFSDRPYSSTRGWHGGGIVMYVWEGALIEDNLFERIQHGQTICDKDNGWDNTFRNNVFRGDFMFAAQGCNDGINFHHNFVDGNLQVGAQPGWLRNIWIHHNALRGRVVLMGGETAAPEPLANAEEIGSPADAKSHATIKNFPAERCLIHAWGNVVAMPAELNENEKPFLNRVPNDSGFALKYRYVNWDRNLVDERGELTLGWSRSRIKWTEMMASGFDVDGASGIVSLDAEGHLPPDSPWRNIYGRAAGRGSAETEK